MYDWCELAGELICPQPMDKPASRCELCLGCLDPVLHPKPSEVGPWLDESEVGSGST